MIPMVPAVICAFCCSWYIYNIIRDNILKQHNSKGSWSSPFDSWEEIQSLKWQTLSFLESNCFIGFAFIPLMMYSRKVMAPYLSSAINICGFFNEHFASPSPFPSEGTSTRGGGGGVMLIHSHPHFWVCFSSVMLARSSFQGQRFPAQGIFLFTQIILLREMPCCDIKWEENKAGDLINELPVDVGMRGQIRHKNKIIRLKLGAERASQSVKIFACVSFCRLAS